MNNFLDIKERRGHFSYVEKSIGLVIISITSGFHTHGVSYLVRRPYIEELQPVYLLHNMVRNE
jgi:hypothetical protein